MIVRYNRLLGVMFLIFGGINLFLGGWLFLLQREFNISLVLGVIIFIIALLYLSRPFFIVEADAVVIPAMLGPVKRTFPYTSLTLQDNQVIAEHNGQSRRVPISRWMSHRPDWDAFAERFLAKS
ncbi:MAG: hypothetical protein KC547_07855 [Anaerolineae bacterium]|nr:hypothetical protein [Anaerolineae bacterium]